MGDRYSKILLKSLENKDVENYLKKIFEFQTKQIIEEIHKIDSNNADRAEDLKRFNELEYENKLLIDRNKQLEEQLDKKDKLLGEKKNESLELQKQLEQVKKKNNDESDRLKEEIDDIKNKFEVVNNVKNDYELNFGKMMETFKMFRKLSEETRKRLINIFVDDSADTFMTAGLQWENIEGLWHFVKRRVIEEEEIDTENLILIFENLFTIFNSDYGKSEYILISPQVNQKFDSDKHIILGTKTDGYVKHVRLKGYMNRKTGKINKAIIDV